jgi:hypothetical protein
VQKARALKQPKRGAKAANGASPAGSDDEAVAAKSDDDEDAAVLKGKRGGAAARRGTAAASPEPPGVELSAEEVAAKRHQLLEKAHKAGVAAFCKMREKWDREDVGLRIVPLGEDRYHRLVWYFPQDRRLLVQTASGYSRVPPQVAGQGATRQTTWGTPALPVAPITPAMTLVDDEDDDRVTRRLRGAAGGREAAEKTTDFAAATATVSLEQLGLTAADKVEFEKQTTWGYVPSGNLDVFIASLDERGRREGPLRFAVQQLQPHVEKMDLAAEGARLTRRSQNDFGYSNRQRPNESGWSW